VSQIDKTSADICLLMSPPNF